MIPEFSKASGRERVLGLLFCAVLLGMGGWLAWDALGARQAALKKRQDRVRGEIAEARRWIGEKALWEERRGWLDREMLRASSPNEASSKFLDQVQKSAASHKLEISQQGLLDPETAPDLLGVGAKIVFRGALKDVARWLVDIQQPGHFVEVAQMELRPLPEAGQVECAAQLRKWYSTAAGAGQNAPGALAQHQPAGGLP